MVAQSAITFVEIVTAKNFKFQIISADGFTNNLDNKSTITSRELPTAVIPIIDNNLSQAKSK